MGGVAFLATRAEPENRGSLIGSGVFFLAVCVLGFLWPILRLRERMGTEFIGSPSRRLPFEGTFIPASKVKVVLLLVGATIFGISCIVLGFYSTEAEYRAKGALGFIGYACFLVVSGWSVAQRRPGILLTESGIVWIDYLYATGLVPWADVDRVQIYLHQSRHNKTPTLGILFKNLEGIQLSDRARKKCVENCSRYNFHCYYHSESLLIPLSVAQNLILYYRDHAVYRRELIGKSVSEKINAGERFEQHLPVRK